MKARRPWTDEELDWLRDLWSRGFTDEQIERRIGRSALAVMQKVRRLRLKRWEGCNRRRWTREEKDAHKGAQDE